MKKQYANLLDTYCLNNKWYVFFLYVLCLFKKNIY